MANEHKAPAGYVKRGGDIAGFWDPEQSGPIHFIPRHCKIFDSSMDATKSSTLIIGELVDPCKLVNEKKDLVEGKKGEQVGIWSKPGMRDIKNLAGVPVYMYAAGEKDVGKPSPMKLFEILSKEPGGKLFVSEDARKKSLPQRDNGAAGAQAPAPPQGSFSQSQDEIPF